ncbi:MAG: AAA domain-containing protein [Bryobacteraceae bacterium]
MEDTKAKGSQLPIRWSPDPSLDQEALTAFLNVIEDKSAIRTTKSEQFWDYWEAFAQAEFQKVEKLRKHPGWDFLERRHGARGTIELYVPKCVDQIVAASRGRIRFRQRHGESTVPASALDIQPDLTRSDWLSVAALGGELPLSEIPATGAICPDWSSALSLQSRRANALKQLRSRATAQPSLYYDLPDGSKAETALATFVPKLLGVYNTEQTEAISKALVPGTITTILGPPGTGKTAVIAEITAQVAATCGRILITSQSNMAVDNALERLKDSEDLFVVRVGRPESVQLNPELMLGASSSRYRARALGRSKTRWEEEQNWFNLLPQIPEPDEIKDVIQGLASFRAAQEALVEAEEFVRSSRVNLNTWRNQLSFVDQELTDLRAKTGIALDEEARLDRLALAVSKAGLDISHFVGREQPLRWASEQRRFIEQMRELLTDSERVAGKFDDLARVLRHVEDKIVKAGNLDKQISAIEIRNAQIDIDRAHSVGIVNWIRKNFLTQKGDVEPLQRERNRIDVPEELRRKSELCQQAIDIRRQLNTVDERHRDVAHRLGLVYVPEPRLKGEPETGFWVSTESLEVYGKLTSSQKEDLARMEKDVLCADLLLREYGSFKGAADLLHRVSLVKLRQQRDTALLNVGNAEKATAWSESAARAVREHHLRVSAQNFPERFQSIIPTGMHEHLPSEISSLDDIRAAIEKHWELIRARRDRLANVERRLSEYYDRLTSERVDVEEAIVADADVIAATCAGIAAAKEFQCDFDWVIIDEAGKADPLDLLVPMVRGRAIVLVGDHRQLPPLLDRELLEEVDLQTSDKDAAETSLFERMYNGSHPSRKTGLALQYRMVPAICRMVKELSYCDTLLSPAGAALERKHPFADFHAPVHWVRCQGETNRAIKKRENSVSPENQAECSAIVHCLARLNDGLPEQLKAYEVGIISMYRAQVDAIRRAIDKIPSFRNSRLNLEVGTVDSFQGRQKDAILVSLVETDAKRKAFFYDVRRLNVALSRARELLIVVGMIDTLGCEPRSPLGGPNPVHLLNRVVDQLIKDGSARKEIFQCP